jgi:hypothetical protein
MRKSEVRACHVPHPTSDVTAGTRAVATPPHHSFPTLCTPTAPPAPAPAPPGHHRSACTLLRMSTSVSCVHRIHDPLWICCMYVYTRMVTHAVCIVCCALVGQALIGPSAACSCDHSSGEAASGRLPGPASGTLHPHAALSQPAGRPVQASRCARGGGGGLVVAKLGPEGRWEVPVGGLTPTRWWECDGIDARSTHTRDARSEHVPTDTTCEVVAQRIAIGQGRTHHQANRPPARPLTAIRHILTRLVHVLCTLMQQLHSHQEPMPTPASRCHVTPSTSRPRTCAPAAPPPRWRGPATAVPSGLRWRL